jgi:hypothetical protein
MAHDAGHPQRSACRIGVERLSRRQRTIAVVFGELGISAPAGLRTPRFVLRPLLGSDAELDYDAVMESREFLRKWEQSTWPEDNFTVEGNREDLLKHERQHVEGEAFTYTVMSLDETECLGCVYVLPPDAKMWSGANVTNLGADSWSECDATVLFWVRKSRLAEGLDRALLDSLLAWLKREWSFTAPVIVTNEQFDQQVATIESTNLGRRFELRVPGNPGAFLAYAS